MNGYSFSLAALYTGILGFLVYLAAYTANPIAIAILAILATVTLICVGAVIVLATVKQQQTKQQQDFMLNAAENAKIMQQQQRLQNMQNQSIMQQLSKAARLPEPSNNGDIGLLIDDGIFDELE